jgi:hypothetical protein
MFRVLEHAIQIANQNFRAHAHVSSAAEPFKGHIDEFRIAHVKRTDGRIETTWTT